MQKQGFCDKIENGGLPKSGKREDFMEWVQTDQRTKAGGENAMQISESIANDLSRLFQAATAESLDATAYRKLCEDVHVAKMYYDMDLGDTGRYRNLTTGELVVAEEEEDRKIILFNNGRKTGLKYVYPYYYDGFEYVHAYIEFEEGVKEEELDKELLQFLADCIYLLASRRNMRLMVEFAEKTDPLSGIPNFVFAQKKYTEMTKITPASEYVVLRMNLQNFSYINERAGARCGDEAIIQYARLLQSFTEPDETACRMDGDNFAMFIKKSNLERVLEKTSVVVLSQFESAPNQSFEVSSWIGISELQEGEEKNFRERISDAAIACDAGKRVLKKNVVVFTENMAKINNRGRDIIGMFRPAIRNREFIPYFQPKVDMRTGELVGFEALCRWIHDGRFIYPDQFIPILDQEGLIPDLDITIFNETCDAIRRWKEMGLNPPRISSNFSRKNLFAPEIESRILRCIENNGISSGDVEIEITESVKESEYDRLIEFVKFLKENGLHISVDDFGTGYSSLSLIHNIDADVIKIDKSFIDLLPGDRRSAVLIESIVSIASRLNMAIIAEGVETAEQGTELLRIGCHFAQGYYYSKPVDFETATRMIREPEFQGIAV